MKARHTVVAIVDDDPRLLESLGDLLESAGHSVHAYTGGFALLESKRFDEIDCLITDVGMPKMDGVELQQLANSLRPDLPVIFITGRQELATHRRVIEAQSAGIFQKPFDSDELLNAVSAAIDRNK